MLNGDDLFLFGGRNNGDRLNDLYHLNMTTMTWTCLSAPRAAGDNIPVGRTWHSLTKVSGNKAILYGGYDTDQKPLSDCWELDISPPKRRERFTKRWARRLAFDRSPRLWHTAAFEAVSGHLWLVGGHETDILGPLDGRRCPETIEKLSVAVPSLEYLAMRVAVAHQKQLDLAKEVMFLPKALQPPIQHRLLSKPQYDHHVNTGDFETDLSSYPPASWIAYNADFQGDPEFEDFVEHEDE